MKQKKIKLKTKDDFTLDGGLDMPDFDFAGVEVKDDRSPTTSVKDGVITGIKDQLKNPETIRKSVLKALPKEYGDAYSGLDAVAGSVKQLYDEAAQKLKPALKDLKRSTNRVLPKLEGSLPKKWTDKLKEFAKQEEGSYAKFSRDNMRDDAITSQLGDIFQLQTEQAKAKDSKDQDRETLRQGLAQLRFKDNFQQLDEIRQNSGRLVAYQDKILIAYQRKSLELQHRQYFATVDMLEAIRENGGKNSDKLDAVVKNTALPEFVKITNSERFRELSKTKVLDDIRSSLFGGAQDYLRKAMDNLTKTVKTKITGAVGTFTDAAQGLDMATSMADDVPVSEMAGNIAGSMAGEWGMNKLAAKAGKYVGKIPGVQKGAALLKYRMSNADHFLDDTFRPRGGFSDFDEKTGQFVSPARQLLNSGKTFIGDMLPSKFSNPAIQVDSLSTLSSPGMFTNATNKSITEIIPGYLARIHREMNALRTGTMGPLLAYDLEKNSFSDQATIAKRVSQQAVGQFARESAQERIKALLDFLDPNKSLDEDARKELGNDFLSKSMRNKSTDSKALFSQGAWSGVSGKNSGQVKKLLQELLRTDETGQRDGSLEGLVNQGKFADMVREIGQTVSDPRALFQHMANAGQLDILRRAGVIKADGDGSELDTDAFRRALMGEQLMADEPKSRRGRPLKVRQTRTGQESITEQLSGQATIQQPQSTMHGNLKELVDPINQLSASLKEQNPLSYVKNINQVIMRIEKQLADGIFTMGVDQLAERGGERLRQGFGRVSDAAKSLWGKGRDLKDKAKKGLLDLSLRDLSTDLLGRGKELFGTAVGAAKKWGGMMASVGGAALRTSGAIAGAAIGKAADYFGDIYVGDELMPRLTYAKLRAGEYRDKATGKVLKSFKDIRGAIVDSDGNVILDVDDIKRASIRARDKVLSLAKGLGQKAWDLTSATAGLARQTLGGLYGVGFDLGMKAIKGAVKLLPAYDVYVKDELEKPVMYATYMRQGDYYFSDKTGKSINHPRDIDGPVRDKSKNFVVTEEQFGKGLVNIDNKSITNLPARLLAKGARLAGKAVGALKNIARTGFDMIGQFGKGVQELLQGTFGMVFGVKGEFLDIVRAQLDVQTKLLKLVDSRLPGGKAVAGDFDGDGLRDGSAEDIRRKEAAKLKNVKEKKDSRAGVAGSNMGTMFDGLKKLFASKKDEADDGDTNVDIDLDSDGKDKKPKKGGKGRASKPVRPKIPTGRGGFGGRLMGGAGKLARGVGRGLAGAGRLAGNIGAGLLGGGSGVSGTVARGVGGGARLAGGLALRTGAALLPAALGALGSFAGLSWGGLAAGAGALLSAPVLLTALGVAAVGVGGYYAYKYLTKAKLQILSTVRYAQYGFSKDDEDHLQAIFDLEKAVLPAVQYDEKAPKLDETKMKLEEWTKPFNIQISDKSAVDNWMRWFTNRFKPVYLAHLSVLKSLMPNVALSEVDSKMSTEEKRRYLVASSMPDGPYGENTSPFADLKSLPMGSYAVASAVEIAKAELDKEAKKSKDSVGKDGKAVAAAATLTAASDPAKATSMRPDSKSAPGGQMENSLARTDVASRDDQGLRMSSSVPVSSYIFSGQRGRIDALTTIRMKTYGLVSMDVDKIKALQQLEAETAAGCITDGEGAKYNGDIVQLLENVKAYFGISGARSARGYDWMTWYKSRFLPTYLTFVSSLKKATGKDKIQDAITVLKIQDALGVANILIGTTTVYEGKRVPVWEVDKSPWDNYAVNLDQESVKLNIEFLTNSVKAVIAGEQKTDAVKKQFDLNREDNLREKPQVVPSAKSAGSPEGDMSKQYPRSNNRGAGQNPILSNDGRGMGGIGDFVGGQTIKHPGQGTGGDVNSLAIPTGPGYPGMKDMLDGVAKMVGVDAKALAAYIAVESNFNPDARPPIDRNTGRRASGAAGLGQFVPGTWNEMLKKYGPKYGLALGTPPEDPRANALMTAEYMRENTGMLKGFLKRDPTMTELYMAHFLGPGGVRKFLSQDPNAAAYDVMGAQAQANEPIFLDRGRPRTFGEIYSLLTKRIEKRSSGLDGVVTAKKVDTPPPSAPTTAQGTKPTQATSGTTALAQTAALPTLSNATSPDGPSPVIPAVYKPAAPKVDQTTKQPMAAIPTPIVEDRLPTTRKAPPANPMRDFVNTPVASADEAQRQVNQTATTMAKVFDGVADIMRQQLVTQRNSESLLRQIATALVNGSSVGAKTTQVVDDPDTNRRPADVPADRAAPTAAVSMRKRTYSS